MHTLAILNHTFLTPFVAKLRPKLSCRPLTTASGIILHQGTARYEWCQLTAVTSQKM
jgi:hypothetical protein